MSKRGTSTDGDGDTGNIGHIHEGKVARSEGQPGTFPNVATALLPTDEVTTPLLLPTPKAAIQFDGRPSSPRADPTYLLSPPADVQHGGEPNAFGRVHEARSTQDIFQVLSEVPCAAGDEQGDESRSRCRTENVTAELRNADLSQSDMADIDEIIGTMQCPCSPYRALLNTRGSFGPSADFDLTTQSQHESSSGINIGEVMLHAFESFEAIGQMQMQQSLGSHLGQYEEPEPLAGNDPTAVTPVSLGLLFALPSMFGLICSVWRVVSSLTYQFSNVDPVLAHDIADHESLQDHVKGDDFIGTIAIVEMCIVDHQFFTDAASFIDDPMLAGEISTFDPVAEIANLPTMSNANPVSTYVQIVPRDKGTSWTQTTAVLLNMIGLIAFACAYTLIPRRCANSQRLLERLSVPQLHAEFKKRGLTPPSGCIRQDLIRHLCEHDGIPHTFVPRKVDKYVTLTKAELQRDLKTLGASISGKKLDLQYRLVVAREAFYNRLAEDELQRIVRYTDPSDGNLQSPELARRLAEAGPQMPLRALK